MVLKGAGIRVNPAHDDAIDASLQILGRGRVGLHDTPAFNIHFIYRYLKVWYL
jgi:hypothetical protein